MGGDTQPDAFPYGTCGRLPRMLWAAGRFLGEVTSQLLWDESGQPGEKGRGSRPGGAQRRRGHRCPPPPAPAGPVRWGLDGFAARLGREAVSWVCGGHCGCGEGGVRSEEWSGVSDGGNGSRQEHPQPVLETRENMRPKESVFSKSESFAKEVSFPF